MSKSDLLKDFSWCWIHQVISLHQFLLLSFFSRSFVVLPLNEWTFILSCWKLDFSWCWIHRVSSPHQLLLLLFFFTILCCFGIKWINIYIVLLKEWTLPKVISTTDVLMIICIKLTKQIFFRIPPEKYFFKFF